MSVDVRPGRLADLPELTGIYHHYVLHDHATFDTETTDRRQWFDGFADTGPHRLLVAASAGRVLGYATSSVFRAKPAYSTTVETTVYLAPDSTGRGVGSALYGVLLPLLMKNGLDIAVAGIALPNEASLALHKRFGFEDVGTFTEVGRKHGSFRDVHWLQRALQRATTRVSGSDLA